MPSSPEEPLIEPWQAKQWLVEGGLAIEVDGQLRLKDPNIAHLAMAGLHIANGNVPRLLSEAYRNLPCHRAILDDSIIKRTATIVTETYSSASEND